MKRNLIEGLTFNKHVLLTGAGFTKDFGGFLADEMWSMIFNSKELGKYPRVRDVLQGKYPKVRDVSQANFSYESVYYKINNGTKYTEDEKEAIRGATHNAYKYLDENIRNYKNWMPRKCSAQKTIEFIDRFRGGVGAAGFFFTLNHDLFIERYCRGRKGIETPGVVLQGRIDLDNSLTYADDTRIDKGAAASFLLNKSFNYIKLHGSYLWRDSENNSLMVLGEKKTNTIFKEPLLSLYLELFQQVLSSGGVKLFVIGYGFNDVHINKIMVDAIKQNSLELFIMDPTNPKQFSEDLKTKKHCGALWPKLSGYFPYSMTRVFEQNKFDEETIESKQIRKEFFGEKIWS